MTVAIAKRHDGGRSRSVTVPVKRDRHLVKIYFGLLGDLLQYIKIGLVKGETIIINRGCPCLVPKILDKPWHVKNSEREHGSSLNKGIHQRSLVAILAHHDILVSM